MTLYGAALKTVSVTLPSVVEVLANKTRQEKKMILKVCNEKENCSALRLIWLTTGHIQGRYEHCQPGREHRVTADYKLLYQRGQQSHM